MSSRSSVIRVSLVAEAERFRKGLSEGEQASSRFTATLKNLGAVAVAAIATKALGAVKEFAQDSIRAFSELEQASGAVESVFGQSADRIDRWAKSAASAIGLSESQAKQSATVIGAFLKNYGFSVDEAADKSIELTNLGADLAAMFGGTVPEAVGAISAALRGEFNPIERYGVSLRVATIEAHALEMGLAKTKSELDQNAKMMATLDLLTKQTASAHGQFARELDTVAGKEAVLNAELENAKALFGQSLAPAKNLFTGLQIWGVGVLTDLAQAFGEWTGNMTKAQSALIDLNQDLTKGKEPLDAVAKAIRGQLPDWEVYVDWLARADDAGSRSAVRVSEIEAALRGLYAEAEGIGLPLEELNRHFEMLVRRGEMTSDEFAYLKEVMAEWRQETRQQERDLGLLTSAQERYTTSTKAATRAQQDSNEETKTEIELLRELHDEKRSQTDAVFGFQRALDNQAAAQNAVNEAIKEHGEQSPEYLQALLDLAKANQDVADAELNLVEKGQLTRDEFVKQQVAMGLTYDQAVALADALDEAFKPRAATSTHVVKVDYQQTGTPPLTDKSGTRRAMAAGGVTTGPTRGLIGEAGKEAVLPLESSQGRDALASALASALGRMGGGGIGGGAGINITVYAGMGADGDEIGTRLVEILQEYARRNGGIAGITRPT